MLSATLIAYFDSITKQLQAKCAALQLQLHLLSTSKQKLIDTQIASLVSAERTVVQGVSQTRNMLTTHDNDVRVLMLKTQIVSNLNELSKLESVSLTSIESIPDIHADLVFTADNKLLDIVAQSNGGIVSSSASHSISCYIMDAKEGGNGGGGGGPASGGKGGGGPTVLSDSDLRLTIISCDSKNIRRTVGGDKYLYDCSILSTLLSRPLPDSADLRCSVLFVVMFSVEIKGGDPKSVIPTSTVIDNKDGSYTLIFQPNKNSVGDFNLVISLRGVPIQGSPYSVKVVNSLDYSRCTGIFLRKLGGAGILYNPSGLAIREGHIYVADYSNHRIVVLNSEGKQVRTFGSPGSGNGQLQQPSSVAFGPHGHVFVSEYGGHRVQVFTADGTFVHKW